MTIRTSAAIEATRAGWVDQPLRLEVEYTIGGLNGKVCEVHGVNCLAEIPPDAPDLLVPEWDAELERRKQAWKALRDQIDARFEQLEIALG